MKRSLQDDPFCRISAFGALLFCLSNQSITSGENRDDRWWPTISILVKPMPLMTLMDPVAQQDFLKHAKYGFISPLKDQRKSHEHL